VALQLTTGARRWLTPLESTQAQHRSNTGAVTAIPGVVLSGGWDGILRAFSSNLGTLLWSFDTVRDFETVNGVTARGGSMGGPGPTVAGGMLFVSSGYIGVQRGMPGNVLLVFSLE
jgi:polyvinyl alcohol dehydrogenase (cytochrome)